MMHLRLKTQPPLLCYDILPDGFALSHFYFSGTNKKDEREAKTKRLDEIVSLDTHKGLAQVFTTLAEVPLSMPLQLMCAGAHERQMRRTLFRLAQRIHRSFSYAASCAPPQTSSGFFRLREFQAAPISMWNHRL